MVDADPPADRRHDPLRYAAEIIERAEREAADEPAAESVEEAATTDAADVPDVPEVPETAPVPEPVEPAVAEAPVVATAADFAEPEPAGPGPASWSVAAHFPAAARARSAQLSGAAGRTTRDTQHHVRSGPFVLSGSERAGLRV